MSLVITPMYGDSALRTALDPDDSTQVLLTVDIERHETFCVSPVLTTFTPSGEGGVVDQLAECTAEIRRLQKAIDEQACAVRRCLTPEEARALAAALNHYAQEAERP